NAHAGNFLNDTEQRIQRSIATEEGIGTSVVAALQRNRGGGNAIARRLHLVLDKLPIVPRGAHSLVNEGADIRVVHLLLFVRELLELFEHFLELISFQMVAKGAGPVGQCSPATVFAENQIGFLEADVL